MKSFYGPKIGPTLREALQDHLDTPHHLQLQLYEELAIARTTALEAIKLASVLFEYNDKGVLLADALDPPLPIETRGQLMSLMKDGINNVRDMVLACAKVEKEVDDKVSLKVINLYIEQIMNIIHDALKGRPDEEELVDKIVNKIELSIRVPTNDSSANQIAQQYGDVMTPDKMAEIMMSKTMGTPPENNIPDDIGVVTEFEKETNNGAS